MVCFALQSTVILSFQMFTTIYQIITLSKSVNYQQFISIPKFDKKKSPTQLTFLNYSIIFPYFEHPHILLSFSPPIVASCIILLSQ